MPCQVLTFDQLEECKKLPKGLPGYISEQGKERTMTTAFNYPSKTLPASKNIKMLCQHRVVVWIKAQHEPNAKASEVLHIYSHYQANKYCHFVKAYEITAKMSFGVTAF